MDEGALCNDDATKGDISHASNHDVDDFETRLAMGREVRIPSQYAEDIFFTAVSAAHLSVWAFDTKARRVKTVRLSSSMARYIGPDFDQALDNVPESLLPDVDENDRDAFLHMYEQVCAGRDASCEVWVKAKRGVEGRCIRITYKVLKGESEDGQHGLAFGLSQDITDEREAEFRYYSELDNMKMADNEMLIAKSHSNLNRNEIIDFSILRDCATDLTHAMSFDDDVRMTADMALEDDDRQRIMRLLGRDRLIGLCREGQTAFSIEYEREKPGSSPIWASIQVKTCVVPSTDEVDCFLYTYDMTQRLIEHQMIAKVTDLDYLVLGLMSVKSGALRMFAKVSGDAEPAMISIADFDETAQELLMEHCASDVWEGVLNDICRTNVLRHLDRERLYTRVFPVIDEGGREHFLKMHFMYQSSTKSMVFFACEDITQQVMDSKKQVERLREAKQEAERANDAKSSFLSSMSHDMRTPLNGIIGYADLAEKTDDAEQKQGYIGKIKLSGMYLLELINDTLSLSKAESGKLVLKPEVVKSMDVLENIKSIMSVSAQAKSINFTAECACGGSRYVRIDRMRIQQIVLNLLSNAIKYTPEGGTVQFQIAKVPTQPDGCNFRFDVQDNGIGISKEFLPRLFDAYTQERSKRAAGVTGTGLGLAIVKQLVDAMGGRIEVVSKVDEGTHFTVWMPIELISNEEARTLLSRARPALASREELSCMRVLVCDDNAMNREIIEAMLRSCGTGVVMACDGQQALQLFDESDVCEIDAILMDVRMPVMDGFEATHAIRALNRTDAACVPIIAMTADAIIDKQDLIAQGMTDCVPKPIDSEVLYNKLIQAMSRG